MASELGSSNSATQRTRRNLLKIGAIAGPATLATIHSAKASSLEICLPIIGCIDLPGPPGGGRGGVNCFLKGTTIRTADGDCKIEELAVGDLLPTMFGGLRPAQWIGRYSYKKSDSLKRWTESLLPVRFARSALGLDVPHADLYVTALHGILVDGVLVPAEMLINGTTITRFEPEGDEMEFFHVKLESHDVIYAEGVPAETLLNVEETAVNFADYLRHYGMPTTEEARCAPYVYTQGGRFELMSRARSALSPWIDLRDKADVVRDRLEEGAYDLV
jgi:hypothetical protein